VERGKLLVAKGTWKLERRDCSLVIRLGSSDFGDFFACASFGNQTIRGIFGTPTRFLTKKKTLKLGNPIAVYR